MCMRVLQLFGLAFLASVLRAEHENMNYLMTSPQSPVVEIGTNFTATCVITNTTEVTADDLYWNLSRTTLPHELYTKINTSALNVTVPILGETAEWLFCTSKKDSPYVTLNKSRFLHGILLRKASHPERPENLSCIALQDGDRISQTFRCKWEVAGRQNADIPTTYTLMVRMQIKEEIFNASTTENNAEVSMTFPNHMALEVWVQAHNLLGTVESEHLKVENANFFVKTNPPLNVQLIPEEIFPTSLLIQWNPPIASVYVKLKYQIRFCPHGSQNWSYVPLSDTDQHTHSFRLQNLQPYTVYVIQVSCKHIEKDHGYWSDWSRNATMRTPESLPEKPSLWRTTADGVNGQEVLVICKDSILTNGRLISFGMRIQDSHNGNWENETIPVNGSSSDPRPDQREVTLLKRISLAEKQVVKVCLVARNSLGPSPETCLAFSAKPLGRGLVEDLGVWPQQGQLFVKWKLILDRSLTEYVIEWVSGEQINWQRVNKFTSLTAIKGPLEPFVCYRVSVYPLYYTRIGKPASTEAFLEQGAPLQGPSINQSSTGYDHAELVWDAIPMHQRRGFITNYTIFYKSDKHIHVITVPPNSTSYTLKSLLGDTKYDVWIRASTIRGSKNSSSHSFTTLKYAPGKVEGIVVGVSLGFLFLVLMAILLCIYKKDVIEQNFWPQVPNPGKSTIGNWSPDNPLRAETPREDCLSGMNVRVEGVRDVKQGLEDDKTSLSLKKDKYLSEEHSSGIGGSSCMSSPRQSVSSSDEDPEMPDNTANTVQYSVVVGPSDYKGQTPVFSRSESTQPLLDSEENPDMLGSGGSRHFQRYPRQSSLSETNQETHFKQLEMEQQDFCSIKEDTEWTLASDTQSANAEPGSASSYMPQRGGYRPQ
uniref:Interleukin 6 signal transducer n=1 Tax=Iconisemion striatum TaxID=60296 RepID=A0A1A7XCK5_9TELE